MREGHHVCDPMHPAMTTTIEPYAVDTSQAAKITGLSPATLNTLRSRGGGPPFVKIGKSVRYRVADLHHWLDERVVASTADALAKAP